MNQFCELTCFFAQRRGSRRSLLSSRRAMRAPRENEEARARRRDREPARIGLHGTDAPCKEPRPYRRAGFHRARHRHRRRLAHARGRWHGGIVGRGAGRHLSALRWQRFRRFRRGPLLAFARFNVCVPRGPLRNLWTSVGECGRLSLPQAEGINRMKVQMGAGASRRSRATVRRCGWPGDRQCA
jgi:hypothetical protein